MSRSFRQAIERLRFKAAMQLVTFKLQLALRDHFPADMGRFYRYQGSLTTPGCNEQVAWTVFKDPLRVPRQLLQHLRQVSRILQ